MNARKIQIQKMNISRISKWKNLPSIKNETFEYFAKKKLAGSPAPVPEHSPRNIWENFLKNIVMIKNEWKKKKTEKSSFYEIQFFGQ